MRTHLTLQRRRHGQRQQLSNNAGGSVFGLLLTAVLHVQGVWSLQLPAMA
jgi:hypothetical protein